VLTAAVNQVAEMAKYGSNDSQTFSFGNSRESGSKTKIKRQYYQPITRLYYHDIECDIIVIKLYYIIHCVRSSKN